MDDKQSSVMSDECPECGVQQGKRLFTHLFNDHSYTKDDIERLKSQRRIDRVLATSRSEPYVCDECGSLFVSSKGLFDHRRQKHKAERTYAGRLTVKCPLCKKIVKNRILFIKHAELEHAQTPGEYMIEKVMFSNRESFEEWKNEVEKKYALKWVVSSKHCFNDRQETQYQCSMASPFPKYTIKSKKTKKMAGYCTAFMKLTERDSGLEVQYCKTHFGHDTTSKLSRSANEEETRVESPTEDYFILLESNRKLLEQFDQDVAALRSKLLRLSEVPNREVKEHLVRLIELIREADCQTSALSLVPLDQDLPEEELSLSSFPM